MSVQTAGIPCWLHENGCSAQAVKAKKQPQKKPARKPPARARKSTLPDPPSSNVSPSDEGGEDEVPNTPTSQVRQRPDGPAVAEAVGKGAAQSPRRPVSLPARASPVRKPSSVQRPLDRACEKGAGSMSAGVSRSPSPRRAVSESETPRGRRRRCAAPSPEMRSSPLGGAPIPQEGVHIHKPRNVSPLASHGGQVTSPEKDGRLTAAPNQAEPLAVFKGARSFQRNLEPDVSLGSAPGKRATAPVQASRGRPANKRQSCPARPAHQSPSPKRGRPSRKRQAPPVPMDDRDEDDDDFEAPAGRPAKVPRTRSPLAELEKPNLKSDRQGNPKAKTAAANPGKENIDPKAPSARLLPPRQKGREQPLDTGRKDRKAASPHPAGRKTKPHAKRPPSLQAPTSSDSHEQSEDPGVTAEKKKQVPPSEAIQRAAKEWAALDEEELAVEPAEPGSPESGFAGILEKLKMKTSTGPSGSLLHVHIFVCASIRAFLVGCPQVPDLLRAGWMNVAELRHSPDGCSCMKSDLV
jgi:hypothetical protein